MKHDRKAMSHPKESRLIWAHLIWAGVLIAIVLCLHLLIPFTLDADTRYHFAVAKYTAEHGILDAFPWTPFSWLAEHWADKEFLFHLIMVPLAQLDVNAVSRIIGTLLGSLLLITLYGLLVREKVEAAGLWVLIMLASSSSFLYRMFAVRPHLLSISLAMLCVWAAVRRKWVLLGLVALLYPFSYTAWHLPIVLVGIVEAVRFVTRRKIEWKPLAIVTGAVAAGVLIHPDFPNNLELLWIQNFRILFEVSWGGTVGLELGPEFDPFGVPDYLRYALLPTIFAAVAATRAWKQRDDDLLPIAVAAVALAFLLLTVRTLRFIEYLTPFSCFALALTMKEVPKLASRVALLAGCALFMLAFAIAPVERMLGRQDEFPSDVVAELQRTIPQGSQVVTCDWGMTGGMLLALPERKFMVALDPSFFWVLDETKYRTWYDTIHRPPRQPGRKLRDTFDAQYVLCDIRSTWGRFHQAMMQDPVVEPVTITGLWKVYRLRPGV